jgi:heme-degrading monooxygenase HmoA
MILEVAILDVKAGQESLFEENFVAAQKIVRRTEGYIDHELKRCIEQPNRYILLVNWQTVEHHTVGFRESAAYQEWRKLLHHFYDPFPSVQHYEACGISDDMDR